MRGIKLTWTKPEETLLEAWLSRGDRRMGEVIYGAWQRGAIFDAWQDRFNYTRLDRGVRRGQPRPILLHPPPASDAGGLPLGSHSHWRAQEIPAARLPVEPGEPHPA